MGNQREEIKAAHERGETSPAQILRFNILYTNAINLPPESSSDSRLITGMREVMAAINTSNTDNPALRNWASEKAVRLGVEEVEALHSAFNDLKAELDTEFASNQYYQRTIGNLEESNAIPTP
jgi:hypothetical protein